jgi:putative tricarboxylic transport membrane protein
MKKGDLITSIVLLALAVVTLLYAIKLPFGTLKSPHVGFFPLVVAILLGIFSLFLLWQAIKEKEGISFFWRGSEGWKRISLTLGTLFAIAIFFERLGYVISTLLLIAFLLWVIGRQKWWVVIMTAFLSALGFYLLFGILLKSQLPTGILSVILGD